MGITCGELIFSTVHGSNLYGLAHEGSDRDVYYVYEGKGRNLRHAMKGDDDSVRGTLDAFLERAYTGSHQSVEALFSQKKDWAPGMFERYGAMLDRLYIEGGEVFAKYERTIKKFSYSAEVKKRVHACRLRLNLQDLREYGRFNPELTETQKILCNGYANAVEGDELWAALR